MLDIATADLAEHCGPFLMVHQVLSGSCMNSVGAGLRLLLLGGLGLIAGLRTAAGDQSAVLGWDPSPDSTVTQYNVYYGGVGGTLTNKLAAGNTTNATINGLSSGLSYFFYVTAA